MNIAVLAVFSSLLYHCGKATVSVLAAWDGYVIKANKDIDKK